MGGRACFLDMRVVVDVGGTWRSGSGRGIWEQSQDETESQGAGSMAPLGGATW